MSGHPALDDAPHDGTQVLAWCVHRNAQYAKGEDAKRWSGWVIASWTDFNGGGWTWYGHCGELVAWLPTPPAPTGRDGDREDG